MAKNKMISYKRHLKRHYLSDGGKNNIFKFLNIASPKLLTSSVRSGIGRIIDCLGFGSNDTILLPSFLPEGIIYPIKKTRLRIKHYRSTERMSVDMNHIMELVDRDPSIRGMIVIHYMGIPQEIDELSVFCKNKGIYLLEDCAHGLFAKFSDGTPIGSKGDVSFFSLPKFLPVPDGGVFFINNPQIRTEKFEYTRSILHKASLAFHLLYLWMKEWELGCQEGLIRRMLNKFSKLVYGAYYLVVRHRVSPCRISATTLRILANIDYDSYINNRKKNAQATFSGLDKKKYKLFVERIEENYFLTGIPIMASDRKSLVKELRVRHIECLSYDKSWFCEDERQFPIENNFARQHLLLPVMEDLDQNKLDYLVGSLNSLNL
jgi:dTDP-4-amino-4,6-dideoxygalactose transaminase